MPENEYTRADYIRALLQQQKQTIQNGALVNPSVGQAAELDTSFQGVQSEPAPDTYKSNRNGWQRAMDASQEFYNNVLEGIIGFFDSIGDAVLTGLGLGGKLFGASDEWAKQAINFDWNGYAVDALTRFSPASVYSGDVFNGEYWKTPLGREALNNTAQNSFSSELPNGGQQVVTSIEQGIGNVLPNIIIGNYMAAAGAGTKAIQAVGLATAGAQGFGAGTSEALKEGATLEQAAASGAISGAIEAGTEAFVGKAIGKVTGAGAHFLGQNVSKAAAKGTAKEVLSQMFEEGAEEFVSELLSPVAKSTYKGAEAFSAYKVGSAEWNRMLKDASISFVGGAVGGGIGAGAGVVMYSRDGLKLMNKVTEYNDMREQQRQAMEDGDTKKMLSFDEPLEQLQKEIFQMRDDLKVKNPKAYKAVMEAFQNPVAAKEKAFKKMTAEQQLQMAEDTFKSHVEATSMDMFAQRVNDIFKKNGINYHVEFVDGDTLAGKNTHSFVSHTDKAIYIAKEYRSEVKAIFRHEAVSHAIFDSNTQLRDSILSDIEKTSSKELHANDDFILEDDTYKKQIKQELKKKGIAYSKEAAMQTEVFKSEQLAFFLENRLNNKQLFNVLEGRARHNLLAVLKRIKNNFALAKGTLDNKILKQLDKAIKEMSTKEKTTPSESVTVKRALAYKKGKPEIENKEATINEKTYYEGTNNEYKFNPERLKQYRSERLLHLVSEWRINNNSKQVRKAKETLLKILSGEASLVEEENAKIYRDFINETAEAKEFAKIGDESIAYISDKFLSPELIEIKKEASLFGVQKMFFASSQLLGAPNVLGRTNGNYIFVRIGANDSLVRIYRHELFHWLIRNNYAIVNDFISNNINQTPEIFGGLTASGESYKKFYTGYLKSAIYKRQAINSVFQELELVASRLHISDISNKFFDAYEEHVRKETELIKEKLERDIESIKNPTFFYRDRENSISLAKEQADRKIEHLNSEDYFCECLGSYIASVMNEEEVLCNKFAGYYLKNIAQQDVETVKERLGGKNYVVKYRKGVEGKYYSGDNGQVIRVEHDTKGYYASMGGDIIKRTETESEMRAFLREMNATKKGQAEFDKTFKSANEASAYLQKQGFEPFKDITGTYQDGDLNKYIIRKDRENEGGYTLKIAKNKALDTQKFEGKNSKQQLKDHLKSLGFEMTKEVTGVYHKDGDQYDYYVKNNADTPQLYTVQQYNHREKAVKETPKVVNAPTQAEMQKADNLYKATTNNNDIVYYKDENGDIIKAKITRVRSGSKEIVYKGEKKKIRQYKWKVALYAEKGWARVEKFDTKAEKNAFFDKYLIKSNNRADLDTIIKPAAVEEEKPIKHPELEALKKGDVEEEAVETPKQAEKPKKAKKKVEATPVEKSTQIEEPTPSVISAEAIKDHAKANYDKFITVKSSNDIANVLTSMVELEAGKSGIKVNPSVETLGKQLFTDYNKFRGKDLVVKVEEVVTKWLDSKVAIEGYDDTTIAQILHLEGVDTKQYVEDLSNDIVAFLEEKADKSKMGKLRELMSNRIAYLSGRIQYYRTAGVEMIKTSNKLARLNKKIKSGNISIAETGLNKGQMVVLDNTLSTKLEASQSKKGFSPKSVKAFVETLGWYNEKSLEQLFPFYDANKAVIKFVEELHQTVSDDNFLKGQVDLETTIKLHYVVNELAKLTRVVEDTAARANLMQIHKAVTEWNGIRAGGFEGTGNFLTKFVNGVFVDFTSPQATFAAWFGRNSSIFQINYVDIEASNSRHLSKKWDLIRKFFDTLPSELKGNSLKATIEKITAKMGKKIEITIHPTNSEGTISAKLTLGNIVDMYLYTLTDQGYNTLKDGGYKYAFTKDKRTLHHMSDEDIAEITRIVKENHLEGFADMVLQFYNGDLRQYKLDSDMAHFGIQNVLSDRVYYPTNKFVEDIKDLDPEAFSNYSLDPAKWGSNRENRNDTHYPIKGQDVIERLFGYIDALTIYGEMYTAMNNYEMLLRKTMKYGDADVFIKGFTKISNYYANQIAGRPVNTTNLGEGRLYGAVVSSVLGANPSVVLKQLGSLPTILNVVSTKSFVKALGSIAKSIGNYGEIKKSIVARSGLLTERMETHEAIRAETLTARVNRFARLFGIPMEKTDEAVIVTVGYMSANYEVKSIYPNYNSLTEQQIADAKERLKAENPTKEQIYDEVIEHGTVRMLEMIVSRTQSNSQKIEMSMARAGAAGLLPKAVSIFSSDLQNNISLIYELATEKKFAKKRIEAAKAATVKLGNKLDDLNKQLASVEEQMQEAESEKALAKLEKEKANLEQEIEDTELSLKETEQMRVEAEKTLNNNEFGGRVGKLVTSLTTKGILMTMIGMFIQRLLGRKGWDEEEDPEELIKTVLFESYVYNLPYLSTVLNAIEYNKGVEVLDLSLVNEFLGLVKTFKNVVESGGDVKKAILPVIKIGGYITGIPFYNMYNVMVGVVKNVDYDTGTAIDAFVRGWSSSSVSGAYNEAVKNGSTIRSEGLLQYWTQTYKTGTATKSVIKEVNSLKMQGYDVLPKNYATSYTGEDGEKVDMTTVQINTFKKTYAGADKAVQELMKVTDYRNATQEEKATMIKGIYEAYYGAARGKAIGSASGLTKMAKMVYYSNGNLSIGKYLVALKKLAKIEATGSKTKKELTVDYINKLSGYSRNEKLLLMYLNGYKMTDANLSALKNFLSSKGFDRKSLKELFE